MKKKMILPVWLLVSQRVTTSTSVITSLTNALDDESVIERLAHTTSVDEVLELLAGRK